MIISENHLVVIPIIEKGEGITKLLTFPDFAILFTTSFWANHGIEFLKVSVVMAIIASIATLLSVEAIDKLDPQKRISPLNRELKAQGVGNIIAGMLGGLPMTAVIVRSSANLSSGSKTKMAAIYHGFLLVFCVLLIPNVLNMIPLSSLAAILLVVGYKLAKPALFKKQYNLGMQQFIPFVGTVVAILYTDLLTGILIGMGLGVFYILRSNYRVPYSFHEEEASINGGSKIKLVLSEHVSFLNKASLLSKLESLPDGSNVLIDGSKCKKIDYDAWVVIEDFKTTAKNKQIKFEVIDMP